MRIITCNLNGIRSAARKGFFSWLEKQNADVVCVQELKAQADTVIPDYGQVGRLTGFFHYAEKPGYSGVGIYSWRDPDKIKIGWGWPIADREGRYLRADFGRLSIVSIYLPSGTSSDERQAVKYEFMDELYTELQALRASRRHVVLCGDWNIAHTKKDIKNWRGNQNNSGFLPEERAWMTRVFGEAGLADAFRRLNQEADQYTWWSFRGQARAKNVGWRIDYQIVTPGMAKRAAQTSIYKDEFFSDHAPLTVDYDYPFDDMGTKSRAAAKGDSRKMPVKKSAAKRGRLSQPATTRWSAQTTNASS